MRGVAIVSGAILSFMVMGGLQTMLGLSVGGALATMLVLMVATIFVHELGHAAGYWLQRGVVKEFAVLIIAYRRHGPTIGWARFLGGDIGGYVIGQFGATGSTPRKRLWVAAGGPLANLVFAAFCFAAASLSTPDSIVHALLAIAGVYSLGTGLINCLPFRRSDGTAILGNWRQMRGSSQP